MSNIAKEGKKTIMTEDTYQCPICQRLQEVGENEITYLECFFWKTFERGDNENIDIEIDNRYQALLSKLPEDPQVSHWAKHILTPADWFADCINVEDAEVGLAVFLWLESCPEFFIGDRPILRFEIYQFFEPYGEEEEVYCNGRRRSGADLERIVALGLDAFLEELTEKHIRLTSDEGEVDHE